MRKIMLSHSGSLRECTAQETYQRVLPFASKFGITRITDTTQLDRIGIPVCAAIRPNAAKHSICVHNGKGAHLWEAKAGALMEALEFEFAEQKWNLHKQSILSAREVEQAFNYRAKFSDLGIRLNKNVSYKDSFSCIEATDIKSGESIPIPSELIYLPYSGIGSGTFGSSTTGLASGNNLAEATVHAISEIMERHGRAIDFFDNASRLVMANSYPQGIQDMARKITAAGLDLTLRYIPNDFDLPLFEAYVMERSDYAPLALAGGYGFHPISSIAASRAVTEAVQSRLTCIHGGRDDILARFNMLDIKDAGFEVYANSVIRKRITATTNEIRFDEVKSQESNISSIDDCLDVLIQYLSNAGYELITRTVLSPTYLPFCVVKVVIPKMEHYDYRLRRVGARLLAAVRSKIERSTTL